MRASAVAPVVGFLDAIGAPVDRLLGQARIPAPLLADAEALLPVFSAYRFLELAARRERMHDLGAVLGQEVSAFDLGAYGAALHRASTVHEYLRIGIRLIGAHSSGTRFWLSTHGDLLRVNQHLMGQPGLGRRLADMYTLVLTISMLRRFIGPTWSPGEIRLLDGNEALIGDRSVFGDAPLITGQHHSSFTVPRSLTGLPVPGSHAGTKTGAAAPPGAGPTMPTSFISSAEQVIMSLLVDGYPSVEVAADAAGMSPRTLQRRLAGAGVTYSDLVAAGRMRLAKTWLTETDMPVASIAAMLAYTEASNFSRAFRRQTGMSPLEYRRSASQRS